MRSLTIADIKEILRIEIRKSILHSHHVHPGTNEFSEEFSSGESKASTHQKRESQEYSAAEPEGVRIKD